MPWSSARTNYHRRLQLTLRASSWGELNPGDHLLLIYDRCIPGLARASQPGGRSWSIARLRDRVGDVLIVWSELLDMAYDPYPDIPVAVFRAPMSHIEGLQLAAIGFAEGWDMATAIPQGTISTIFARRPPRLTGPLPRTGDVAADLRAAVDLLDHSYLVLQGPAGCGKTFLTAQLIQQLIEAGQSIAVVGRTHAAIEDLLDAAARAGVPIEHISKKPRLGLAGDRRKPYHCDIPRNRVDDVWRAQGTRLGALFGGTPWSFTRADLAEGDVFDLLIVADADQFPIGLLASMTRHAPNLLLVGDPAGHVRKGSDRHPEPIDRSVLTWLTTDSPLAPDDVGYVLHQTRRMPPGIASVVAELAYPDALTAHPDAGERELTGVAPGVHPIEVDHRDRRFTAPEEVDAVVDLVRRHLGVSWRPARRGQDRPLHDADILVLAPGNAHAAAISRGLTQAGFPGIAVGTPEQFRGAEAAVVIVSMGVSAPEPLALATLLSRRRLAAALSRAQWVAYLVHAPQLVETAAANEADRLRLAAFRRLVAARRPQSDPAPVPVPGSALESVPVSGSALESVSVPGPGQDSELTADQAAYRDMVGPGNYTDEGYEMAKGLGLW